MILLAVVVLALVGAVVGFLVGVALGPDQGGEHGLVQAASGMGGGAIGLFVGGILGLLAARMWSRRRT